MNAGNLQVSKRLLEDVLNLPPGHKIKYVVAGVNPLSDVGLIIEGPSLPEITESDLIPFVMLECEKINTHFKEYKND